MPDTGSLACLACAKARRQHGTRFVCIGCFNARFSSGDYRRTPQWRQAHSTPLSRTEIKTAHADLEAAGVGPMLDQGHTWGAHDSGNFDSSRKRNHPHTLDPWDAVDDALDADDDPVDAQGGSYAAASETGRNAFGEHCAESQRHSKQRHEQTRPKRVRPSRAAYMRAYRARKKAA